jgi:hypothetical protein
MAVPRQRTESVDDVRERLLSRFPQDAVEVTRQFDLAVACADHLGVTLTPTLLENLVVERLNARAASRPASVRISPAVPLVCRGPRSGQAATGRGNPPSSGGGRRTTPSTGDS